jgi:hypothetical protein
MEPKYSPSILLSLHPARAIAIVLIGGATCVFTGSLILGRIKPDAGMFLAGCGLARLAALAGPVGVMLRNRLTTHPNWVMFVELGALAAVMLLFYLGARLLGRIGLVRQWPASTDSTARLIVATCVQAVLAGVMVSIFAFDDSVKQTMTSVCVASLAATVVVQGAMPINTSTPLWLGTLLSGLVQYAWSGFSGHLVNVSPLAYASMGIVGSIAGLWASLRWNIIIDNPTGEPAIDSL